MSREAEKTRSAVIEQACEAAFSGSGACTEKLAEAVHAYLLAHGDDEMAADLAKSWGFEPAARLTLSKEPNNAG